MLFETLLENSSFVQHHLTDWVRPIFVATSNNFAKDPLCATLITDLDNTSFGAIVTVLDIYLLKSAICKVQKFQKMHKKRGKMQFCALKNGTSNAQTEKPKTLQ